MGTNYYYVPHPPCECCRREYPKVHIGKASVGWKFIVRARDRADTWESVKAAIKSSDHVEDEYGCRIDKEEMIAIVESTGLVGRSHSSEYGKYGDSWRDDQGYEMSKGDWC